MTVDGAANAEVFFAPMRSKCRVPEHGHDRFCWVECPLIVLTDVNALRLLGECMKLSPKQSQNREVIEL